MSPRAGAVLGWALLSGCNVSKVATHALERQVRHDGFEQHLIQVDVGGHDCVVSTWVGGDGPPVLLLHGFGGNGLWTWEKQLDAFAAAHTVIVPDLLWFGESTCGAPPGLDSQAAAMAGLLDVLDPPPVDVIGVSYGGFTTFALYGRVPERIRRAVILDSPGPAFLPEDRAAMTAALGTEDPAEVFVPDSIDDVRLLFDISFADPPTMPDWAVRDILDHQFTGAPDEKRAMLAELDGYAARVSAGDTLFPLPSQSLVVWGALDPIFPLTQGQRLANMLDAPLVVIEPARHAPNVEFPEQFNAPVLAWLATGELPPR